MFLDERWCNCARTRSASLRRTRLHFVDEVSCPSFLRSAFCFQFPIFIYIQRPLSRTYQCVTVHDLLAGALACTAALEAAKVSANAELEKALDDLSRR